jgi:hypothetical protein
MVNLRGVGDMGHPSVGAMNQAGEAKTVEEKKKKELRDKLKNLSSRDARKGLEEEFGREINDPHEREAIEHITENIRKNADKFI